MYLNWGTKKIHFQYLTAHHHRAAVGPFTIDLRQQWGWVAICSRGGKDMFIASAEKPGQAVTLLRKQMLSLFKAFGEVLDYEVEA